MDVAVSARAAAVAAHLEEAGFGRAVPLSDRSPLVYRIAGRREVDLAQIEGATIQADLGRRDFTVNAMAFDLEERAWLDPFGGRRDLAARRLRAVCNRNLEEDPLRVLRAARFLATHGLEPDSATSRACRSVAPRLAEAAPERIRVEWIKLIEAPRARSAIAWAARWGVLAPAFGLDAASARRLGRSAPEFDALRIRRLSPEDRRRVRLALLCARAGIPSDQVAAWLAARRYGRAESGDAAALLRLIDAARRADSDRSLWAWVRDAGPLAREALALGSVLSPRRAGRWRELDRRARRANRRGPRLSGSDVIAWSGLPGGRRIGAILAELEVEVLRGSVRSRRDARAWVSRQAGGGVPGPL